MILSIETVASSAEPVENYGHRYLVFFDEGANFLDCFHAMDDYGFVYRLCQYKLPHEDRFLLAEINTADLVETNFTDGYKVRILFDHSFHLGQNILFVSNVGVPWVYTCGIQGILFECEYISCLKVIDGNNAISRLLAVRVDIYEWRSIHYIDQRSRFFRAMNIFPVPITVIMSRLSKIFSYNSFRDGICSFIVFV